MSANLKFKATITLLTILLSVYLLLPTFMHSKERREAAKRAGAPLPWFYNLLLANELNLGLDLRGGLYLELGVDLDKAMERQIDVIASDLGRVILANDFPGADAQRVAGRFVRVTLTPSKHQDFLKALRARYGEAQIVVQEQAPEMFFNFTGPPAEARKQALKQLEGEDGRPFVGEVTILTSASRLGVTLAPGLDAALTKGRLTAVGLQSVDNRDVIYLTLSEDYFQDLADETLEQAANSVRNRIDRFGVAEASVSLQGGERMVVELPGVKDPDAVIDIIKQTGELSFRLVDDTVSLEELVTLVEVQKRVLKIGEGDKPLGELKPEEIKELYNEDNVRRLNAALKAEIPQGTEVLFQLIRHPKSGEIQQVQPYLVKTVAEITGNMIESAGVDTDSSQGIAKPVVTMAFNNIGTKAFAKVTSENTKKQLAIVLDGQVVSDPIIDEPILTGSAIIRIAGTPKKAREEANRIALVLKEGALPAKLNIESKSLIGPSLGEESIRAGLKSMLVAAIVVVFFMLVYYKMGGLIANLALVLNMLFIFALLCLLQASLTLPGIAGIVLTMGMAVDANVIIFERMREEKKRGRPVREVVESGYGNAMSAILDGNITTFIAGLVLFEFGTGPIKGFATTLMIGIATTLFSAVVVTRFMYDWLVESVRIKNLSV